MWDVLQPLCFILLKIALVFVVSLVGEGLSAVAIIKHTRIGDIIECLSRWKGK